MNTTNVWKMIDDCQNNQRRLGFMPIIKADDLLLVINQHPPGYKIKFHQHCTDPQTGTTQSYLVLRGKLTVRMKTELDGPVQECQIAEGDIVTINAGEFYELENESNESVTVYQAKRPADWVQFLGKEPIEASKHFGDAI